MAARAATLPPAQGLCKKGSGVVCVDNTAMFGLLCAVLSCIEVLGVDF